MFNHLHSQLINPELIKQELARRDLANFTTYTWNRYELMWHHSYLARKLTEFFFDPIKNRLIVELPPQHGKTELITKRLPSFMLGINPDLRIAAGAYNEEHANKYNVAVQKIINTHEYNRLFPGTTISGNEFSLDAKGKLFKCTQSEFQVINHKGSFLTVGIGGSITGNPVDIGIVDDPFKDLASYKSEVNRNTVWEWYNLAFDSRLHNKSKVIIVQTRWGEDDLIGRIKSNDPENKEGWEFITLRAICEHDNFDYDPRKEGEALWPERVSLEELLIRRSRIGEKNFVSLYQQRPSIETGEIYCRDSFKEYDSLPKRFSRSCISIDATFKGNKKSDYVVIQAWGVYDNQFYLIDQVRDQMGFVKTLNEFVRFCKKHNRITAKLIEDKANGPAIIDVLKKKTNGVIAINPKDSKEARAHSVTPLYQGGDVFLPKKCDAPWVGSYIEEHVSFPYAKYDDQVDCANQALDYLKGKKMMTIEFD